MMAVVQTGSRTFRSACATKRRVCRSFWAWTDGAPRVMAAAAAAPPRTICRRLMRSILEFPPYGGCDDSMPARRCMDTIQGAAVVRFDFSSRKVCCCAGFRTPGALISPHAPPAGVRKAPRHEIASGGSAWAVPQGIAEQEGYGDLGMRAAVAS